MNKIISPLIFADTSPAVSDLQTALSKLGFGEINADELNRAFFGESTCKALTTFKDKFRIKIFPGVVESQTADKINQRLERVVDGQPHNKVRSPLVFGMKSEGVRDLQTALRMVGFGAGIDPAENNTFGKTTGEAVLGFQREMGVQVVPCYVDNETAEKINSLIGESPNGDPNEMKEQYKVSGFVFDSNNKKIDQQPVVAYDIDLLGSGIYKKATTIAELTSKGGVQLLGNGISNADGFYNIEFTRPLFVTDESIEDDTADVLVLAIDGEEILGRSLLSKKRNYQDNELKDWDVTLFPKVNKRSSSEYARVSTAITKYLDNQITKVAPWQVKANGDMLEFLVDEINIDAGKVDAFVSAGFLIHDATGAAGEVPVFVSQWPTSNELLYGLARQSVKLEWPTLSQAGVSGIVGYIMQSSNVNIISLQEEQNITAFATALLDFSVKKTLRQNTVLKAALSIALDSDDLIEKFHTRYANRLGTQKNFWENISNDDDLKDKLPQLKLTNQLAALTGNHATAMARLAPLAQGNNAVALLELSNEAWSAAIGTDFPEFITGDSNEEKSLRYRDYMRNKLHAAFYNEKVSLMAKKEEEIKIADQDIREMLSEFLTSTKFDLRQNRLHDKIKDSADTFQKRLDEIGGERKAELNEAVNKVQRVFQFSPSPEVMTKLLEAGIDSATMVVSMPFSTFQTKYKSVGDEHTLLAIYQRATHIVSMLEFSILSLNRFSQSAKISAIGGPDEIS